MSFKGSKSSVVFKALFSFLFACMMALDQMIVHADPEIEIFTDITQNYVGPVSAAAIIVFICSAVGMYVLLIFAHRLIRRLESKRPVVSPPIGDASGAFLARTDIKLLLLFTLILGACWLPYLLANIPGGVWFDNYRIYNVLWGRSDFTNHQPVLYTLLHGLVFKIILIWLNKSMMVFVMTMTMIQYTVFAVSLSWFLCWLKRRKVSKVFFTIVLLFLCFFPLIPAYAISNWKDTLFSAFLFLFAIAVADAALDGAKRLTEKSWLVRYLVLGLLVCFFRNNGVFIVIICTALIVIRYRKEIIQMLSLNKILPKFIIVSIIVITVPTVIQEPVFSRMGLNNDRTMEMVGVPLQQVVSIILSGGDVREEELEFIDKIFNPDVREVYFSPNGVSPMKRNVDNSAIHFLEENREEFLRVWLDIVSRNPGQALDAFLLTTLGFWNANRGSSHGYIQTTLVPGWEYHGLEPRDLVNESTGFDLRRFLEPRFYFSAALFGWIALFCFTLVCLRKKYTLLLPFMPFLVLWGTVLIATPLAYSLRYVYGLVLLMPLAFYLVFQATSSAAAEDLGEEPDGAHSVHGEE